MEKTTVIQKGAARTSVLKGLVISLALTAALARGGVTVTQDTSVTNWSAGALIATVADPPGLNATSVENNFGTANVAQTFTAPTNIVLTNIQMFVSGTAQTFNLHLFDLGTGYVANSGNPSPYTPGGDLFSGIQLAFTASTGNGFVINLAFTGADQVLLGNGHKYAFELEKVSGGPMTWYRTGSDIYANGDAYRDRSLINGAKRDFALAVFGTPTTNSPAATPAQCTVDWNDVHQRIDGFGASSAWRSTWNNTLADLFFSTNNGVIYTNTAAVVSTNNGIGLSLLRTRIAPGGTTIENSIMQLAQARGAKVWSAPWSPAANFKSNGNVNGGGFVGNANNYQAYANQLAGYVAGMKNTYGVSLYALSVQNEPDANVTTYESCNWNAQQIHDFVPYLSAALTASNVASTKIILPESQNWPDYSNLVATAMSDSTSNLVGIVADHNYDGASGPASLVKNSYGKPLWETEVSLLSGNDGSISNGVYYAGRIHLFMTVAQANAWHYWWLITGNSTGNQGLMDTTATPTKRMFALGQFSRFVRPNYYRIGVTNNTGGAQISAYKDSLSPGFAIVAINPTTNSINQTFTLTNFSAASVVTPWMTTSNLSLAHQTAVTVTNLTFSYALPAMSIVTFAGQATNNPPVLAPVSGKIINAGATLALTNVATDPESPPQTLTFSLLSAPTNAALNSSSGTFTWRPLVSQAGTTNLVSVAVTDNGTPNLSATNNFNVTVNPLNQPALSSIIVSSGQITLVADGTLGPDYTLLTSTDLVNWRVLFTTNSPALPVTLVDTNAVTNGMGFYRIEIGP